MPSSVVPPSLRNIAYDLSESLRPLEWGLPVYFVYDPTDYAIEPLSRYFQKIRSVSKEGRPRRNESRPLGDAPDGCPLRGGEHCTRVDGY